jgi:DNA gyrase subunit A
LIRCQAAFVESIAKLVDDQVLAGISDIRDESDRNGMRVVVEVKRGAVPEVK